MPLNPQDSSNASSSQGSVSEDTNASVYSGASREELDERLERTPVESLEEEEFITEEPQVLSEMSVEASEVDFAVSETAPQVPPVDSSVHLTSSGPSTTLECHTSSNARVEEVQEKMTHSEAMRISYCAPYDRFPAKSMDESDDASTGSDPSPSLQVEGPTSLPTTPGAFMVHEPLRLQRIPSAPGAFPVRGPSGRFSDSSGSSSYMDDDVEPPSREIVSPPIQGHVVEPDNIYEVVLRRRLSLEIEARAIPRAVHTRKFTVIHFLLAVGVVGIVGLGCYVAVAFLTDSSTSTFPPTLSPVNPTVSSCENLVLDLFTQVDLYLADPSPDAEVSLKYGYPIGTWCVTGTTNFQGLFSATRNPAAATFNEDLSGWDMSYATVLESMFDGAAAFDQDLAAWDTARVVSMKRLFKGAAAFNGDVSTWNTENVLDLSETFHDAVSFDGDLSLWNTENVETMKGTFLRAKSFNQPLNTWKVHKLEDMSFMFAGALVFDQDLDTWDVSSVILMSQLFEGATAFNGNVTTWDVSSAIEMQAVFRNAISFNQDVSRWPVKARHFIRMFENASTFNQDLCAWRERFQNNSLIIAREISTHVELMFHGTACPVQTDPEMVEFSVEGPFCHVCT